MMLRNVELRKLPAGTLSVIVDILEINNDWKKVMSAIPKEFDGDYFEPKYNMEHIRLIEEYAKGTKQKCAEILFDEWGTSGRKRPTLGILKDIVVAAGVYRAGDEIALLLQEPLPLRPYGGPEQQITTNVTEMLNQSMQQQISTAPAKDYDNKNVYQNRTTEPIQTVYCGVESINTEDLPNISELHTNIGNKSTAEIESVREVHTDVGKKSTAGLESESASDLIKFSKDSFSVLDQNFTELKKTAITTGQAPVSGSSYQAPSEKNTIDLLRDSVKPSSNVDLDSIISQDTNLIHFNYCYLESITHYFSEDVPVNAGKPGKIGSGGFGDVFIGNHPDLGTLAIKRANQHRLSYYKPELISKLFNSEVKYLSKFRHKNIVSILGYSVDGPAPCIICEYIPGGSLLQKISEKILNEDQRIHIMIGAAEGLKYLHISFRDVQSKQLTTLGDSDSQNTANNFMHGDVKSANILLTQNNEPKLCDFGLAKQYEATCEVSSPMGTSAYMAPEGLQGTITQKLDVYSYGVVLLELLTGLTSIVQNEMGEKINITLYVNETCKNGDISQLLDTAAQWTQANAIYKLTQMCLLNDRKERPTMSFVCDTLHKIKNNKLEIEQP